MRTATTPTGWEIQRLTDHLLKRQQPDGAAQASLIRQTTDGVYRAFLQERYALAAAILGGEGIKRHGYREQKLYAIVRRITDAIAQPIVSGVRAALGLGVSRADRDLLTTTTFTLRDTLAETYLKTQVGLRIVDIADHTRSVVRAIVANGVQTGAPLRDIADRIYRQANAGGVFSRYRAEMIARNEVGSAYIHAQIETVREASRTLGLTIEKQWTTAGDDRVDDSCLQAESDGWIPFEDTFSNGMSAPPEHVNCRCSIATRSV